MKPIIESCIDPTYRQVHRAARAYLDAGLSFIPISCNLMKMPAFELLPDVWCGKRQEYRRQWGVYRQRQPTRQELRDWFLHDAYAQDYGMAILGGAVSGNLEILDLDNYEVAKAYKRKLDERAAGLFRRLVKVKTPRPGLHLYYRCDEIAGNQKLARISDPDPELANPKPKTVIETKGEGGYVLCPPSPRDCHPRQKCYRYIGSKDLTQVPTITQDEREALFDVARTFDTWKPARQSPRRHRRRSRHNTGGRPGDDFNRRADWAEILEPHGWVFVGDGADGTEYWRRPGKTEGISATTNYADSDLLYVWSTNADSLESERAYTKFSAYALLELDGDYSEAARELAGMGYGGKPFRSRRTKSSPSPYAGRRLRSRRR